MTDYDVEVTELIPSTGKREGWQRFLDARDRFVQQPVPTRHELLQLHELVTPPARFSDMSERGKMEFIGELTFADRPDGDEKFRRAQQELQENSPPEGATLDQFYTHVYNVLMELCLRDTRVEPQESFNGVLRQLGVRSIHGQLPHAVYHSHMCVYGDGSGQGDIIYRGLSVELREVYAQLCNTYDTLMNRATTLDEKLAAEAFFQTVGTRPVHPFFDGNGRTFLTHLALTLTRAGFPCSDYDKLLQVSLGLTTITSNFLERLVNDVGIGFMTDPESMLMQIVPERRREYMKRLRAGLDEAINFVRDPNCRYSMYFASAAWQIKRMLIYDGAVQPQDHEKEYIGIEREQGLDGLRTDGKGLVLFIASDDIACDDVINHDGQITYATDVVANVKVEKNKE